MAKKTEIDQRLFERLCFLRKTKDEIAEICGVTERALDNWCKRTYDGKTVTQVIGWKKIQIDETAFKNLCRLQCTLREIADFFGCSHDTIERWCKETYGDTFSNVYAEKRMDGVVSVRRAQFEMAHKIPSMSIWWGKQYLGQKEPEKPHAEKQEAQEAAQEAAYTPVAFIVDDLPRDDDETAMDGHEAATWGIGEDGLPITASLPETADGVDPPGGEQ